MDEVPHRRLHLPARADLELWAAARVVTEHGVGGRCNCRGPDECTLLAESDQLLRRWETEHKQRYPNQAPSWQTAKPGSVDEIGPL